MTHRLTPVTILLAMAIALVWSASAGSVAHAADLKYQAELVWGTDDSKPPEGKTYKPVDPKLAERLRKMLKWRNYFEVRRTNFVVSPSEAKKVVISEKCQLDVKHLGNSNVEVVLIGKGKEVARQRQALPKGEMLVLGGNAPNATAWLLALKRIE